MAQFKEQIINNPEPKRKANDPPRRGGLPMIAKHRSLGKFQNNIKQFLIKILRMLTLWVRDYQHQGRRQIGEECYRWKRAPSLCHPPEWRHSRSHCSLDRRSPTQKPRTRRPCIAELATAAAVVVVEEAPGTVMGAALSKKYPDWDHWMQLCCSSAKREERFKSSEEGVTLYRAWTIRAVGDWLAENTSRGVSTTPS